MGWRYAHSSVPGAGHARGSLPCQDRARIETTADCHGEAALLAVACDGAGSAARAELGAEAASLAFLAEGAAFLRRKPLLALEREDVVDWLEDARLGIAGLAGYAGHPVGDLACTLLGAVIGRRKAVFVQIGDGAIVYREAGSDVWSYACWPQGGELVNTTYFLTDADALARVDIRIEEIAVDEVVLMTDGVQALALDFEGRCVHAPFVEGLLRPVRSLGAQGESPELSEQLGAFLSGPRVTARTDDDTSLILASWKDD